MLHRKWRQLDAIKTTSVDYNHWPARENTFGKRMNAALWAEAMFNGLSTECVGGYAFRRREQAKTCGWNTPLKCALLWTDWAIALRNLRKFALDFEGYLTAVTATFVFHLWTPLFIASSNGKMICANDDAQRKVKGLPRFSAVPLERRVGRDNNQFAQPDPAL
jgi:hypothetical protein